jgi:hypothetical protein
MAILFKQWALRLAPLSAGGYFSGSIATSTNANAGLTVILPNVTSSSVLQTLLKPIFDEIEATTNGRSRFIGAYSTSSSMVSNSIYETEGPNDSTTSYPGIGQTKLVAGWLWGTEAMTSPRLRETLANSLDEESITFANLVAGPGTANPPYPIRGGSNAVNPAWRKAIVRASTQMNWPGRDYPKLAERLEAQKRFYAAIRSLAPESGAYPNEGNVYDDDYATSFWGENYPRLLKIKQEFDPEGVLWCWRCVGNEDWKETEDGHLCRTVAS